MSLLRLAMYKHLLAIQILIVVFDCILSILVSIFLPHSASSESVSVSMLSAALRPSALGHKRFYIVNDIQQESPVISG
jgi:hypothetical protein